MKISLSKSQWEEMGKKAGWMKKNAAIALPKLNGTVTFTTSGSEQGRAQGSTPLSMNIKTPVGEWQILINETQDSDLYSIYEEIIKKFGNDIQQAMKQRSPQQPQAQPTAAPAPAAPAPAAPPAQPK